MVFPSLSWILSIKIGVTSFPPFKKDEYAELNFERVVSAKVLTKNWIARTYQVQEDSVIFVGIYAANAIKFSFPRPRIQGDPGETDMYSGQQYAPLLDLDVR